MTRISSQIFWGEKGLPTRLTRYRTVPVIACFEVRIRVADPDPHGSSEEGNAGLDPPWSQNSGAFLEAENRAEEGPGRTQWRRGGFKMEPWSGSIDQWLQISMTLMRSRIRIWIRIKVKSWTRIRFTVIWIRNPGWNYTSNVDWCLFSCSVWKGWTRWRRPRFCWSSVRSVPQSFLFNLKCFLLMKLLI
jgi:hypothetical protein